MQYNLEINSSWVIMVTDFDYMFCLLIYFLMVTHNDIILKLIYKLPNDEIDKNSNMEKRTKCYGLIQ